MHLDFLARLRCPFCGTRLTIVENDALERQGDEIAAGVVGCECCAFPVVDGIPVLVADDTARAAIVALEAGRRHEALEMLQPFVRRAVKVLPDQGAVHTALIE